MNHALLRVAALALFALALLGPAEATRRPASLETVTFVYQGAGATFTGELKGPWPTEARAAFDIAIQRLADRLVASVPIVVVATWEELPSSTLGTGGPTTSYLNFPGAPRPDVWYPSALANQLAGRRLGPGSDIEISINSRQRWFTGTAVTTPDDEEHLVATIIHEIIHGLGFLGTCAVSDDVATCGDDDGLVPPKNQRHDHRALRQRLALMRQGTSYPDIFDVHVVDSRSRSIIDEQRYPNGSDALFTTLQSNALFWDGPAGRAAHGNARPKLYAPDPWSARSSFGHLDDDTFDGTPDALMIGGSGTLVTVDPGPVTLGILADLGWRVR